MKSADTATIFDIQRFSLHDGPGIRTTIFFKGCPLACAWCQNPESHSGKPELLFFRETCTECFTCRTVCPEDAILEAAPLRFDPQTCKVCGACTTVCPTRSLRLAGKQWNATELTDEALKDIDFFHDSGGGITLSGGEPLLQTDFLLNWLPQVKKNNIHVTLETCGLISWDRMENLLPWIDLVFYDLKMMSNAAHRQYTGRGNTSIRNNFAMLSKSKTDLQARMPVIPGINSTPVNIQETAQFLRENGQTSIHLLPYHQLGESKLSRLNTRLRPLNLPPMKPEALKAIQESFARENIHAVVYD